MSSNLLNVNTTLSQVFHTLSSLPCKELNLLNFQWQKYFIHWWVTLNILLIKHLEYKNRKVYLIASSAYWHTCHKLKFQIWLLCWNPSIVLNLWFYWNLGSSFFFRFFFFCKAIIFASNSLSPLFFLLFWLQRKIKTFSQGYCRYIQPHRCGAISEAWPSDLYFHFSFLQQLYSNLEVSSWKIRPQTVSKFDSNRILGKNNNNSNK